MYTTDLHDLELPLDFIIVGIRSKLLLEHAHFHLQLFLLPHFSLRTFLVVPCELGVCDG